jgi:hypothetical protein
MARQRMDMMHSLKSRFVQKLGPTPTRAGSCICWVRQNGGFQSRPRLRAPATTILAQVPCLYHNPPQESSRKQNFDILRLP